MFTLMGGSVKVRCHLCSLNAFSQWSCVAVNEAAEVVFSVILAVLSRFRLEQVLAFIRAICAVVSPPPSPQITHLCKQLQPQTCDKCIVQTVGKRGQCESRQPLQLRAVQRVWHRWDKLRAAKRSKRSDGGSDAPGVASMYSSMFPSLSFCHF